MTHSLDSDRCDRQWLPLTLVCVVGLMLLYGHAVAAPVRVPNRVREAVQLIALESSDSFDLDLLRRKDDLLEDSRLHAAVTHLLDAWFRYEKPTRLQRYLRWQGLQTLHQDAILIAYRCSLKEPAANEARLLMYLRSVADRRKTEDDNRRTADSIRGTYIPRDPEDCFRVLDQILPDSSRASIARRNPDSFLTDAHFGLGTWMRNYWHLWGGGRLNVWFEEVGVFHPEDISGIILRSYVLHLRGAPLKIDSLAAFYRHYWGEQRREDSLKKRALFESFHRGDTVEFSFPFGRVESRRDRDWSPDCMTNGIVLDRDSMQRLVKIRVLNICGARRLLTHDNKNFRVYDRRSDTFQPPRRRHRQFARVGQQRWFRLTDWSPEDNGVPASL